MGNRVNFIILQVVRSIISKRQCWAFHFHCLWTHYVGNWHMWSWIIIIVFILAFNLVLVNNSISTFHRIAKIYWTWLCENISIEITNAMNNHTNTYTQLTEPIFTPDSFVNTHVNKRNHWPHDLVFFIAIYTVQCFAVWFIVPWNG